MTTFYQANDNSSSGTILKSKPSLSYLTIVSTLLRSSLPLSLVSMPYSHSSSYSSSSSASSSTDDLCYASSSNSSSSPSSAPSSPLPKSPITLGAVDEKLVCVEQGQLLETASIELDFSVAEDNASNSPSADDDCTISPRSSSTCSTSTSHSLTSNDDSDSIHFITIPSPSSKVAPPPPSSKSAAATKSSSRKKSRDEEESSRGRSRWPRLLWNSTVDPASLEVLRSYHERAVGGPLPVLEGNGSEGGREWSRKLDRAGL